MKKFVNFGLDLALTILDKAGEHDADEVLVPLKAMLDKLL